MKASKARQRGQLPPRTPGGIVSPHREQVFTPVVIRASVESTQLQSLKAAKCYGEILTIGARLKLRLTQGCEKVAKLFFNVFGLHDFSNFGAHSLRVALPQAVNSDAHRSFGHAEPFGKIGVCDLVIIA